MDIGRIIQTSLVNNANSPLFIEKSDETRIITYSDAQSYFNLFLNWTFNEIQPCFPSSNQPVLAFLGSNSSDYLLAVLACIQRGFTTSLLNIRWTPLEIVNTLRVQCKCPICSPFSVHKHASSQADLVTIIIYAYDMKDIAVQAMSQLSSSPCRKHVVFILPLPYLCHQQVETLATPIDWKNLRNVSLDYNHIQSHQVSDHNAIILFTSGTSSSLGSKGCCLSHRSLFIQAFAKTCHPCCYNKETKLYATPLPFFHVGGFSSALGILLVGGSLVFSHCKKEQNANFQPLQMIQSISSKDFTQSHTLANTLAVVPAMLHIIFSYLHDRKHTFPNVKLILVGGQSLSLTQLKQCNYYFPKARVVQTYACTEAGSSITFATMSQTQYSTVMAGKDASQFVGYPPKHIEIQIIDPDSIKKGSCGWTVLPPLHIGLIATKGPHVMNSYWCREDLKSPKSNDGWLVMNDLGYLTKEGSLYYCGRSDDVIRTGSESVLAIEIERVLIQHPLIDAVCVFPLHDEKFGQIVCAAIQPKRSNSVWLETARIHHKGCILSEYVLGEIRVFCSNNQLANYKHPKKVFIFQQLPQNSLGKIQKFAVIKMCSDTQINGSGTSIQSKL